MSETFLRERQEMYAPIDNFLQSWLSQNGRGLSVWKPLVYPGGFISDIDGGGNSGNINKARNAKEDRSISYSFRRQKRYIVTGKQIGRAHV